MLLALRDQEGTVGFGSNYVYGLCGAILAELLLTGRIAVDDNRKKLVNLVNNEPFDDAVIDECLQKIATARVRCQWTCRRALPEGWSRRR